MSYLTTIFAFIFIIFISTSAVQNGGGGGDSIISSPDLISFQVIKRNFFQLNYYSIECHFLGIICWGCSCFCPWIWNGG